MSHFSVLLSCDDWHFQGVGSKRYLLASYVWNFLEVSHKVRMSSKMSWRWFQLSLRCTCCRQIVASFVVLWCLWACHHVRCFSRLLACGRSTWVWLRLALSWGRWLTLVLGLISLQGPSFTQQYQILLRIISLTPLKLQSSTQPFPIFAKFANYQG